MNVKTIGTIGLIYIILGLCVFFNGLRTREVSCDYLTLSIVALEAPLNTEKELVMPTRCIETKDVDLFQAVDGLLAFTLLFAIFIVLVHQIHCLTPLKKYRSVMRRKRGIEKLQIKLKEQI